MAVKTSAYLLLLAGLGLFTALIAYHGVGDIAAVFSRCGWGVAVIALYHAVPLLCTTAGWKSLLPGCREAGFSGFFQARWIGESVNSLLPAAQVGGTLVKARMLFKKGVPGNLAGASSVVELTLSVITQIVFTFIGIGIIARLGNNTVALASLIAMTVLAALVAGFCLAQRFGMFARITGGMSRLGGNRDWEKIVGSAQSVDSEIKAIYANRPILLKAFCWRLLSWLVGAGEVWLALYFLGAEATIVNALLLESLGQAVRAAAFMVPGAFGVQEGGFLVLGGIIGLTPELSLSVSLAKRARELLLGLPGLAVWQIAEGKSFAGRLRRNAQG